MRPLTFHRFWAGFCLLMFVLCITGIVRAQTNPITFTISPTSCAGSCSPVATWSTSPAASSCTASDGWSGTKAASGTSTLSIAFANTKYTLTCTFNGAGTSSKTVSWTPPTLDTNNVPLAPGVLAGYNILWGNSPTVLNKSQVINDPAATSLVVSNLASGTWFFQANAFTSAGDSSAMTATVSTTVGSSSTSSSSANLTVRQVPKPPGNFVVTDTQAFQVVKQHGVYNVSNQFGTATLGAEALAEPALGDGYCVLAHPLTDSQPWKGYKRTKYVAAKCAVT